MNWFFSQVSGSYDFDISNLQMEYIATSEYVSGTTWTASYVIGGSNIITNVPTSLQHNSTDSYYLISGEDAWVKPDYHNVSHLESPMANGGELSFEIWVYYDSTEGTPGNAIIMNKDTGWGPLLCLNNAEVDGIGVGPGGGGTYQSSEPGFYYRRSK